MGSENESCSDCLCSESTENFTMVSLTQFFVRVPLLAEEIKQLVTYLRILEFKQAVVYVNDPIRCAGLAEILEEQGFGTTFIHELIPQKFRLARLMMFKEGDVSILVTSCCGHAMEFKNVDVIIMFDEVERAGEYNHRVASKRARKGLVINFIRKDKYMAVLRKVEKLRNVTISPLPSELYTSAYLQPDSDQVSS